MFGALRSFLTLAAALVAVVTSVCTCQRSRRASSRPTSADWCLRINSGGGKEKIKNSSLSYHLLDIKSRSEL